MAILSLEMDRFEIEEIVNQDKNGVIFRARNLTTNTRVAIHRFFPFGKDGGGLEMVDATAYIEAANNLVSVRHPALRSIHSGGIDPIDGIPFLVIEWIEGASLEEILTDENLDPALVIDVLRLALEVSMSLSRAIGEEAVWVDTEVRTIVLGDQESGRRFTFSISPLKWLGGESRTGDLSDIVKLGEELTGWKRKVVNDHAGNGLGGWLKRLKNNPDISLQSALESLATSTGNEPPPPEEEFECQATQPVVFKLKRASLKGPLLAIAGMVTLIAAIVFFLHKNAKTPKIATDYAGQKSSEIIAKHQVSSTGKTPRKAVASQKTGGKISSPPDDATARVNALAEKMSQEATEATKNQQQADAKSKESIASKGGIFGPEDSALASKLPYKTPIKIRGVLRGISKSGSGKTLFLNFSNPQDPALLGVLVHQSEFKGKYAPETFALFIDKEVVISGSVFIDNFSKKSYVKILSTKQISLAK